MGKNNQTEAPKVETKKLTRRQEEKRRNALKNQEQHERNIRFVLSQIIKPEETVKEIHTYRKKGKKVIEGTRTVVKQKRPSKLIRKHIRALIRDEEGRIIKGLDEKLELAKASI